MKKYKKIVNWRNSKLYNDSIILTIVHTCSSHQSIYFDYFFRFKETDQEIRSMCYYNLLRPSENEKNGNDNEYILCFIMADEKNNLDL